MNKEPKTFNEITKVVKGVKGVSVDIEKIFSYNNNVTILISQRGRLAKTYEVKQHIEKDFIGFAKKTIWIRNTKSETEAEVLRFLNDGFTILQKDNFSWRGTVEKNTCTLLYNGVPIVNFITLSLTRTMKGTRTIYDLIVYDEFNEGVEYVRGYTKKINDMLFSTENQKLENDDTKFIIMGNLVTLNNKLLFDLKIFNINKEITQIDDFLTIYVKTYTENEKVEIRKELTIKGKNWRQKFSERLGFYNHSVLNETVADFNGIVDVVTHKHIRYDGAVLVLNENHFFVTLQNGYWLLESKNLNDLQKYKGYEYYPFVTWNIKDATEYVNYIRKYRDEYSKKLYTGKLKFNNVYSRSNFIKNM